MAYTSIERRSILYKGSSNGGEFDSFRPVKVGCHVRYRLIDNKFCFGELFLEGSDFR